MDVDFVQVLMGNNQSCKIHGSGTVKLRMSDESVKIITEVRFIFDLKRNLISLGTLDQKRFNNKCQDGVLKIIKGYLVVMREKLQQELYVLQGNTITAEENPVEPSKDQTALWSKRLGHVSIKGFYELSKQGLPYSKKINNLQFYENLCWERHSQHKINT